MGGYEEGKSHDTEFSAKVTLLFETSK